MSSVVEVAPFGIDFASPHLKFPLTFGPFTVFGRLGVGGMGVVLDASNASGARIALKILHAGLQGEHQEMMQARLEREARLLQRLSHPGIVRLDDVGEHAGILYVAMERVTGVTLAQVKRRASLTPRALLGLAVQLSDSLAHMHDVGVIHRDIKPSNVLIDRAGKAVLADFGIAWMRDMTGITKVGEIVGSAGYVAPEYFKGRPPSPLSDQYALGKLLFELASRRPAAPVPDDVPMVVQFAMRTEVDWSRFPSEPPWPAIEHACIRRMVHAKPERRFPNMRACLEAFLEIDHQIVSPSDFATEFETDDVSSSASHSDTDANTRALGDFVQNLNLEPGSPWSPSKTEAGAETPGGDPRFAPDARREVFVSDAPGQHPASVPDPGQASSSPPLGMSPPLGALSPSGASSPSGLSPPLGASSPPLGAPSSTLPSSTLASSSTSSPFGVLGEGHKASRHPTVASSWSLGSVARASGKAIFALLAGAGVMHFVLALWPSVGAAFSDVTASWMSGSPPALKYSYEPGSARTQDRAETIARTMRDARVELDRFDFGAAEATFARCVELTDYWQCHAYLAAILGLRRDPSARAHLKKSQNDETVR